MAAMSGEGVIEAEVSLSEKSARVTARAGVSPSAVVQAIEATGQYTAKLVDEENDDPN